MGKGETLNPLSRGGRVLVVGASTLGPRTVDSPFQLAGETKHAPRMAPEIGQHTKQILEECGISATDIAALTPA